MQKSGLFALVLAFLLLGTALGCSTDSECGSADAPGVCVGGFCQCGVGFSGNVPIDPITCSQTCAPPAVPDSVAFLNEPAVTLGASGGNLELSLVQDSYLKQNPTTVSFLNPTNGSSCPVLSSLIGNAVWTQGVNAAGCDQTYAFSRNFASEVAQNCWIELPATTETGSQFSIDFRNFQTQLEVIQSGMAPFGQSASRQGDRAETLITREFRRNYTLSVATQFRPSSAPFLVEATGNIQYRLVLIDYNLLEDKIVVQVETRTPDTAKILSASLNGGSVGVSSLASPITIGSACDASSPAGFCSQFATVEFSADPCAVTAADLRLDVVFACANGADPATCGFANLPAGNVFLLPNNIVTYDACPVVVSYGLDVTNSWLRLHEDVARTTVISSAPLQEATIFGRVQLQAEGDAVFSSATVTALHIWQVASPANIDLGDQKTSAFLTVALDTSTAAQPTIDFDLTIDPAFFDIATQYYVEAYVDLVFANTGPISRSLKMMIPAQMKAVKGRKNRWSRPARSAQLHNEVVYLSRNRAAAEEASQNKGVFSSTFKIEQANKEEAADDNSQMIIIIAAAVGGACLIAAVAVIVVVVVKKRKNRDEEETEETSSMEMSV